MNVLVTGASGFTGGHLARTLRRRGHTVRGLVRPTNRASAGALEADGIEVVYGDLRDPASLGSAVKNTEVVYHVAALYREAGLPPSAFTDVNVHGTKSLLDASGRAGVRRVVHCSTAGVHGHVEHPPATEDAPIAPGDQYQVSKVHGEQAARAYATSAGAAEVVIARPVGIYGPGDTRFLKMFRGIAHGTFPMLGRGDVFYHLTYVDDVVEGLRRCGEVQAAAGGTFLIAGPRYTTLQELVDRIARVLRVAPPRLRLPIWPVWLAGALCEAVCVPLRINPPLYRRRVDFYRKSRAFDASRARRVLGFEPAVDLDAGLSQTADWYRAQGLL